MFRNINPLHILYWLLILLFLILSVYLLVKLYPFYRIAIAFLIRLFSPFIIACLIAYLLYPVIKKLHTERISKGLAIIIIYIMFFGAVSFLIYQLYPVAVFQLRDLNEHLPQLIEMYEGIIYQLYESTSFLPETVHDKIDQLIFTVEQSLENVLTKMVGGVTRIFDFIVIITVIPVLVFYFLKDFDKIKSYIKEFIPKKFRPQMSELLHAVDDTLGKYIRGQLIVGLFVGLTTWIAFELLDVKYPLLLAIIMGLTNIIPYFGPIIGSIPAVLIAITISSKLVIYVLISVLIIQIIESNLLSPYIVGKSIDMHPAVIIFALLLGGQIGGIIGMIIAVPTFTITKVIVRHLRILRTIH